MKLLSNILKTNSVPFGIIHLITNRCNLKCKHCFVYHSSDSRFRQGRELNLKEIIKLTKSINGHQGFVSISGGEPLLRKDLFEISQAYVKYAGVSIVEISTNGYDLASLKLFVEKFLKNLNAKLYISISFDGLKQTHNANRGLNDAFEQALRSLQYLLISNHSRLHIGTSLTIFDQDFDEIRKLFFFLINDIKVKNVSACLLRGKLATKKPLKLNFRCYEKLNALIEEQIHSGKLTPSNNKLFSNFLNARAITYRKKIMETYLQNHFISHCTSGKTQVVICPDGTVYPCEMTEYPMGKLINFDMNLPKLLKSKISKETLLKIKKNHCFCTYECAWGNNIIFNPNNWKDLFKEFILLMK